MEPLTLPTTVYLLNKEEEKKRELWKKNACMCTITILMIAFIVFVSWKNAL